MNFKRLSVRDQKKLFDRLMVLGWKDLKYVSGSRNKNGGACALGAVEHALGLGADVVESVFPALAKNNLNYQIAYMSNIAGSKEQAILNVKKIDWTKKYKNAMLNYISSLL